MPVVCAGLRTVALARKMSKAARAVAMLVPMVRYGTRGEAAVAGAILLGRAERGVSDLLSECGCIGGWLTPLGQYRAARRWRARSCRVPVRVCLRVRARGCEMRRCVVVFIIIGSNTFGNAQIRATKKEGDLAVVCMLCDGLPFPSPF